VEIREIKGAGSMYETANKKGGRPEVESVRGTMSNGGNCEHVAYGSLGERRISERNHSGESARALKVKVTIL